MSIRAAKLYVEIGGETRGAEEGMARVDKGVKQLAQVGSGAMKTFGAAIVGAGAGLLALGGQALGVYGEFERLGMSLQQLAAKEKLNAGEAANMEQALAMTKNTAVELQGWIQKLAIESPFTTQGVADAFKMSMAYGFTTDEAKRLTMAMIDFAAGSGATEFTMQKIALALGQIQAKGKLAGGEVLQLTEAGLNVRQILADAFGKTTAEIVEMQEKGLIPANLAIEAIVQSLERDFGGAAQRQSGTITGLVASLEDLRDIGQKEFFGPLFREFQPDLERLVATLQDPKTIENIRVMGEEFAGLAREITTSGGEVIGWFRSLEDSTQTTVLGLGLLALNAGTVIKTIGGLGMVLSGAGAAISTSVSAWNAGLSLTTALQAGLGTMPVTLGAIGLAAAAVTGIWIAWNENIEKTNRLGNQGVESTFGDFFGNLRGQGADAQTITSEFIAAYERMNAAVDQGGIAGLFVDRNRLAGTSLRELSDQLAETAGTYEEYQSMMLRAAESTGILSGHQYQVLQQSGDQAKIQQYLANATGMLTEKQWQQVNSANGLDEALKKVGNDSFRYNQAQAIAIAQTNQATAAYDRNLKKAIEVAEAKERMAQLEGELTEATKALAQAEGEWSQKAGSDIVSQLEQAGIRGEDYRDALSAIDEIYGTSYGMQHDYMEDVKALVEEYRKTHDIDTFKRKMGELRETYQPFQDSVKQARGELAKLRAEYDSLRSKVIRISVEYTGDGGGGTDETNPGGGGPPGGYCFVGETPVNTPSGYQAIEDLQVGDMMSVLTERGALETGLVQRIIPSLQRNVLRVLLSNGQQFRCTSDHPWKVKPGRWVKAGDLEPGMALYSLSCPLVTVLAVEPEPGEFRVYDLTVDHPEHTFLVGGIVVHNKESEGFADGGRYGGGVVRWNERGDEMLLSGTDGYILNATQTSGLIGALQSLVGLMARGGGLPQQGAGGPVTIIIDGAREPERVARDVAYVLETRRR